MLWGGFYGFTVNDEGDDDGVKVNIQNKKT